MEIVAAGLCMAAAALLRALFDYVAVGLFVGLPIVLASFWTIRVIWAAGPSGVRKLLAVLRRAAAPPRPRMLVLAASVLLAFLAYQGALLPYRIYKQVTFERHGLVDFDPRYAWGWSWMTDEELPWFHRSGNAACRTDFRLCKIVRQHRGEWSGFHLQKLAVATFLAQPGRWVRFKLQHLDWFWFGGDWDRVFLERPLAGLEGLLLFLFGVSALVMLWVRMVRTKEGAYGFVLAAMLLVLLANVAVFTFLQYEWRYSQPLRTMAYFLPLWAYMARRAERAASPALVDDHVADRSGGDEPVLAG
jgi:hypothetical protein